MLHIIGLGLNKNSITNEGKEALSKCKKVYLENYTVDFPYSYEDLEKSLGKEIISCDREFIEQKTSSWVFEAKNEEVALLVYGSPLTATTHMAILKEALKQGIGYKVYHNSSIFEVVLETGLQFYKFGKTASMPAWQPEKDYRPDSFMRLIMENKSIDAHSLILCDISLRFEDALEQLKEASKKYSMELKKIIVCSEMGTENQRIICGKLSEILEENKKQEIKNPFCIIIPEKLHFTEEEFLDSF